MIYSTAIHHKNDKMIFENREEVELFQEKDVLFNLSNRMMKLKQEIKVLRKGNIAREKGILNLKITFDIP